MVQVSRETAKVMKLPAGDKLPRSSGDAGAAVLSSDVIGKFPGPALAVDGELKVLLANVHAGLLEEALKNADSPVATLVHRTFAHGAPITHKVTLRGKAGVHHVELIAMPARIARGKQGRATAPAVFLLARDTTLEQNLTQALVDSRQMFKDLLICAGDFAWETDAGGILRYVSPTGGFGYAAHEMTGRVAADFLAEDDSAEDNPFTPSARSEGVIRRLWRGDGSLAEVLISAIPVVGSDGRYGGARGICRDITAEREQQEATRRMARAESLSADILALAGRGLRQRDIVRQAAAIIGEAWSAPCAAFLVAEDGVVACDPHKMATHPNLRPIIAAMTRQDGDGGARPLILAEPGDKPLLVVPIRLGATTLGALMVALAEASTNDDAALAAPFELAANTLGVVLDHARLTAASARAPGIDDLHSLHDSAEFDRALASRLESSGQSSRISHLLALEIDGYLAAMGRIDHAIGEAILNEFARTLRHGTRSGDLLAWLGDARFALWLDRSDLNGAVSKIERLKATLKEIAAANGLAKSTLNLSCGVAPWPLAVKQASAPSLLALASAALDEAKRKGRGQWAQALAAGGA